MSSSPTKDNFILCFFENPSMSILYRNVRFVLIANAFTCQRYYKCDSQCSKLVWIHPKYDWGLSHLSTGSCLKENLESPVPFYQVQLLESCHQDKPTDHGLLHVNYHCLKWHCTNSYIATLAIAIWWGIQLLQFSDSLSVHLNSTCDILIRGK